MSKKDWVLRGHFNQNNNNIYIFFLILWMCGWQWGVVVRRTKAMSSTMSLTSFWVLLFLWMGTVVYRAAVCSHPRLRVPTLRIVSSLGTNVSRWQVLEQVDKELAKGDDRTALSLVKDLQGKPDGLRCFGAARQVNSLLFSLICI